MAITEPDSPPPPEGAPQMPQAATPGPAPAPYTGPDQGAGIITYAATGVSFTVPSVEVLKGVTGDAVQESGYAHDVNAGPVAPYSPGSPSPVQMPGAAADDVAGTVAGAVATATSHYLQHESDTHPAGSTIGDPVDLPPVQPAAYYDPPRSY